VEGNLLIFDGDCAFCSSCVRAAGRVLPGELRAIPWQRVPDLAVSGVNAVAAFVYDMIARNRDRLPGGTPACTLPEA
jgi:predicted DCC family thiol-disulfide oxidoreductase YuxK